MFAKSVAAVQGLIDACKKIAPDPAFARSRENQAGRPPRPERFQPTASRVKSRARSGGMFRMNIHEYQAKAVLKEFGAPFRAASPFSNAEDAEKLRPRNSAARCGS